MTIKAIETAYKGYRFRSRLEARWAVFFDAMGLKWAYEPEGFELPSGRYLPDFCVQLLCGRTFVEIKGAAPTAHECQLAKELASSTGEVVLVVRGDPADPLPYWFGPFGYCSDLSGAPLRERFARIYQSIIGSPRADISAPAFVAAAGKARAARFEFGETPA